MTHRLHGVACLVAGAAIVAAALTGCAGNPAGGGNSANGAIAVTRDDALLYAADGDLDTVFVLDTRTDQVLASVKVGRQPEKVLIAPDDTVYVTNRLDRSVSVLRRGEATEAARIAVGVEPVGLAVSSDSRTLYVVNSTSLSSSEFGTLMAIDTATRQPAWELPVGAEPRGITLLGDGRAAITLYKSGGVVLVDLGQQRVLKGGDEVGTQLFTHLNRSALGVGDDVNSPKPFPRDGFGPSTSRARGLEAITTSHDGQQVYVASLLSSEALIVTEPNNGTPGRTQGSGYGGSTCGATAVAAPGLITLDLDANPLVDDLTSCGADSTARPPTLLTSREPGAPIQGPRAMVLDPGGGFLFVANFESNNVAIVPTATRPAGGFSPHDLPQDRSFFPVTGQQVVQVGDGPTGIAVAHDGSRAWVFNSFDHSVSRLERVGGQVATVATRTLASDVLPPDVVAGRKLFFSASDARMNNPSMGISCGSCHLEGREDGHVWNFAEGPRQTPSLAGRMLSKTAPFHWNGEFDSLTSFMALTVQTRMGGSGVTPAMERQVAAFLDTQPGADNPHRTGTPADALARGRAAFEKANCNSCHTGEAYTDNKFADVGTFVLTGPVPDQMSMLPHGGLNTPSLLGLARSGPYLHTGAAPTLKARILQGKEDDLHGATSLLDDAEVDDLVLYLKTL